MSSSGGGFGHAGHDQAMRDYQRMMMMQANDEQRAAYQKCLGSAEHASMTVQRMVAPSAVIDVSSYREQTQQLQAALAEMSAAHEHFAQGLSQFQEKELRGNFKKMQQLQQEVNSRIQRFDQELSGSNSDGKRIQKDSQKIQKALDKWRAEHRKVGRELGIES
jgi:predicted RNase H-like nuclease (RuvC/YqgF family)